MPEAAYCNDCEHLYTNPNEIKKLIRLKRGVWDMRCGKCHTDSSRVRVIKKLPKAAYCDECTFLAEDDDSDLLYQLFLDSSHDFNEDGFIIVIYNVDCPKCEKDSIHSFFEPVKKCEHCLGQGIFLPNNIIS